MFKKMLVIYLMIPIAAHWPPTNSPWPPGGLQAASLSLEDMNVKVPFKGTHANLSYDDGFVVDYLGSVATAVVTVVCPPAALPFDTAARLALTPYIEAASLYVGLAGGIAGGAATGPA